MERKRRQLRQRLGRNDQRTLQGRGHPPARTMAVVRSRRIRHAGMGRLVQQQAAARTDRQHPARRSRRTILRHAGRHPHGSITQSKGPPAISGRFSRHRGQLVGARLEGIGIAFDQGWPCSVRSPFSWSVYQMHRCRRVIKSAPSRHILQTKQPPPPKLRYWLSTKFQKNCSLRARA